METDYYLPLYGVGFGDIDKQYTSSDISAAMAAIVKHFNLIRTYDDFGTAEKYTALMNVAAENNIDVILGIPNVDLINFDANTYLQNHAYQSGNTPWSHLKCIIVGNETYNGENYTRYAPLLNDCVESSYKKLITHQGLEIRLL